MHIVGDLLQYNFRVFAFDHFYSMPQNTHELVLVIKDNELGVFLHRGRAVTSDLITRCYLDRYNPARMMRVPIHPRLVIENVTQRLRLYQAVGSCVRYRRARATLKRAMQLHVQRTLERMYAPGGALAPTTFSLKVV